MPTGAYTGKGTPHARPPSADGAEPRDKRGRTPSSRRKEWLRKVNPAAAGDASGTGGATPEPPPTPALDEGVPSASLREPSLRDLPDDDPFLLIDSIDASGGIEGAEGGRMTATAAAAFRRYCLEPPSMRTLPALHKLLEREWKKGPALITLQTWNKAHKWEALLREFDTARDRIRFWQGERDVAEANDRQAREGKSLQSASAGMIAKIMAEYQRGQRPLYGNDGKVIYNQRTGQPVMGPKPTLAGIQGLAVLYKIAVETERIALGAPTMITKSDSHVQQEIESASAPGGMSLEEWRQKTARERMSTIAEITPSSGSLGPTSPGSPLAQAFPQLAPPVATSAHAATLSPFGRIVDALTDDEMAALPAEWTDDEAAATAQRTAGLGAGLAAEDEEPEQRGA